MQNTPSLDFLKDLVSAIPDPSGPDEGAEDSEYSGPKQRKPRTTSTKKAGGVPGSTSKNGISKKAIKAEDSPSVLQPSKVDEERVSIPISSLLAPADEEEVAMPKAEDAADAADGDDAEVDAEMQKVDTAAIAAPLITYAGRAKDEDEDYDE